MRFTILTALAFVGLSMATSVSTLSHLSYPIPSGGKCKQDGSLGNCESNLCVVWP
ncbi:Pc20g12400 [Penicillium rubens Wisconsin 54-1255]|uniref:Pc20g12400 protein n=1 Tax=Penicillium rubens (strain ATCC 28089 / DSM 1075 / NRRL 1951 / Wisconsin 54-1255) TaxID=500485 RepID=B6HGK1_PENRW|nr:Pc20g12400 [Penicillium rubens Wisconsin 54-1255]